jgi:hypothetical protein
MIDLIFCVNDPLDWHRRNLLANRSHYATPLRWFGPRAIAAVQGSGVHFNPFIKIGDRVSATDDMSAHATLGGQIRCGCNERLETRSARMESVVFGWQATQTCRQRET